MNMKARSLTPNFAALVQEFFCERLIQQQNVSHQTVASYRDTFRLLLSYLRQTRRKQPVDLTLADLDAPTISAFLKYLGEKRRNTIRTRNVRFAAIRSFMKYVSAREPASLPIIQRVLAIPLKRFARPAVRYLSRDEVTALLDAPDASTWSGQRDRILFALLYNTGARVSEVVAIRRADVRLDSSRSVQLTGKGRKHRVVPLWKGTAQRLREWMAQIGPTPDAPVFPNRDGRPLSRSGVEKRLRKAVHTATDHCATLRGKRLSPHTFRHTTAMHLLQAGVDITVIALWLGHESIETTHQYVEANMAMKDRALAKVEEIPMKRIRYRPSEKLLQFLDDL
jgi:site-specific recombinase XerD